MSRAHQQHWANRLEKLLLDCEPDEFLIAVRAITAGYEGSSELSKKFVRNLPHSLVNSELTERGRLYEWELETLLNECIRLPRRGAPFVQLRKKLDLRDYRNFVTAARYLRELENSDYGVANYPVLKEMPRIAARQFEWQTGWRNRMLLYRAAQIFSHPVLENRIRLKRGFTVNEITMAAFTLWAATQDRLTLDQDTNFSEAFMPDDMRDAALAAFSISMDDAVRFTREARRDWPLIAYRPSVLRKFPFVRLQSDTKKLVCPFPDLIFQRSTSGLYYDVVSEEGVVRDALGKSFENYINDLLHTAGLSFEREFEFRVKKNVQKSPDFLLMKDDLIEVLLECKSVKLSFGATFADHPEKKGGYSDLAKGVFQIWRHASRVRREIVKGRLSSDAVGMVITLDDWLVAGRPAHLSVLNEARKRAATCSEEILAIDRVPILFTQCRELEFRSFSNGTENLIADIKNAAKSEEFTVGPLSMGTRYETAGVSDAQLGKVLSWWNTLSELSDAKL